MSLSLTDRLKMHLSCTPQVHPTAYVAPSAVLIGNVHLGPNTSVWPTAVLRGDIDRIEIGEGSNVQDGAIIHLADDLPAIIGRYVTIGHGAIVHAARVEDECLIGMRSTILDGAVIGRQSLVAAGSVVTPGTHIPEGSMVMGIPAKVIRLLTQTEREELKVWADRYVQTALHYLEKVAE